MKDDHLIFEKNFHMGSFLVFVLPTMVTYVFNGFYTIVDGAFIEEFQGPFAIAAVNLYYPILNLCIGLGLMIGVGGSVALAALMGEGKKKETDTLFSQIILVTGIIGIAIAVIGNVFCDPIMVFLNATEGNIAYALPYYRIMVSCSPILIFASVLFPLFLAEGKAGAVAVTSITGGILNIILDYVFMGVFDFGVSGAAAATMLGYALTCLYGLFFYFPGNKRGSSFRFRFVVPVSKRFFLACYNGISEMVSYLASGVTALILNHLAYRLYLEVGVSVVSVYLYVQFLIMAFSMGITEAAQPAISYQYGKGDLKKGKRIYRLSMSWILIFSLLLCVLLWLLKEPIAGLFFESSGESLAFHDLAVTSLSLAVPACLLCGVNIFITGVFTAFLNGTVSGLLSVLRTVVFLILMMYGLTAWLGGTGLWLSWFAAEALALIVGVIFLFKYRKKYGLA